LPSADQRRPGRSSTRRVALGDLLLGSVASRSSTMRLTRRLAEHASVALGFGPTAVSTVSAARSCDVSDKPLDGLDRQSGPCTGQDQDRGRRCTSGRACRTRDAASRSGLDHGAHVGSGSATTSAAFGRRPAQYDRPGSALYERISDQRAAAQRMENLGLPRAHPLTFSSSEDDGSPVSPLGSLIVSPSFEITS